MRERTWRVGAGRLVGPAPFVVVGIVNATPDSFYDGGRHASPEQAVAWGGRLAADGAHILDVGGESTRPGAGEVDAAEEARRVVPVVRALAALPASPRDDAQGGPYPLVSVDTYKAATARAALEAGAVIINDVSAARFDPDMAGVLAEFKPGYVLMHSLGRPRDMQADPRYKDVVEDILAFFEERLDALVRAGLPEDRVALDPGIGFGKTLEHNLDILRALPRFSALGRPLFIGLSNKSLWGTLLGLEPGERLAATQAGTAWAAVRGVFAHRVHEAAEAGQTLAVIRALAHGAAVNQ